MEEVRYTILQSSGYYSMFSFPSIESAQRFTGSKWPASAFQIVPIPSNTKLTFKAVEDVEHLRKLYVDAETN